MDISTIVGWMLGGLACRIYAGATAVWAASEAMVPLRHVAEAFKHLP